MIADAVEGIRSPMLFQALKDRGSLFGSVGDECREKMSCAGLVESRACFFPVGKIIDGRIEINSSESIDLDIDEAGAYPR